MSEETSSTHSPDETVAADIMTFLKTGLVRAEKSTEFQSLLASGKLTSEDWRNEIDLATAPKKNEQ
jgi:hypothetical protein